jgi:heterodisulfide reductase subunit C
MSKVEAAKLHPELYPKLNKLTFGFIADLEKCMQCGKCVGNCPAAAVAPYNSRRIIHAIKSGNIQEVIESEELWSCFFCSTCYASCPKDINFPFTVAMLRYASLYAGYGIDYVKRLIPYATDYYNRGMTVLQGERNPKVAERLKKATRTDGTMASIRRRMGLPAERAVSPEALAEIQFISDVSGMTRLMKEMSKKDGESLRSVDDIERVQTVRSREGKFAGFPEERDDAEATRS